jgi:hypothetical protein
VTKQIKSGRDRRGYWQLNRWRNFGCPRLLQIAMLSILVLQIQLLAQAQGTIVDLYNWSDQTQDIPPSEAGLFAFATSPTSAEFRGGFPTNSNGGGPPWLEPCLNGTVDTTSGATYEISYALSTGPTAASVSITFGDFTSLYEFPGGASYATNLIYTVEASSSITPMTFQCYMDPDESIDLTGLSIQEVPELSTWELFLFGACILLIARQVMTMIQRRKLAVEPIA